MNKLKRKFAVLIAAVCTSIYCGCASSITHEYSHYNKMTTDEAIHLVCELRVFEFNPFFVRPVAEDGQSRRYSIVKSIDQSCILLDRAYLDKVNPSEGYDYRIVTREASGTTPYQTTITTYVNYYKVRYQRQRAYFADIVSIKLDRRPALIPGAPSTHSIYLDSKGGSRMNLEFSDHPEKYKDYLSALLVLCPNVK